jgi:eukaryotic-like serine/threonine-protein kinase
MIGRTILGRYEIQRLLGEGGMGRVYLAKQTDLGRQVVVKVMHDHIAADEKFRERFQRETLLMARFHHPYAVTLYDASLNAADGSCIVMEYVKGGNLESLLEKVKKMTAPRVVRVVSQLCEVLQAAHEEGIIHRDLKPANLMVIDPDTPKERIKVMDFGLAKLMDNSEAQRVTDTSVDFAVGTPAYICPEQVRGETMDHRGDLYSVGIMAYELLMGRVPFKGNSGMDVLLAHATEDPPTFAALGASGWVPDSVEAVIRKCLAKDPAERQQSARELAEELNEALQVAQVATESGHRLRPLPTEPEPQPQPKSQPVSQPVAPRSEEVLALTAAPVEVKRQTRSAHAGLQPVEMLEPATVSSRTPVSVQVETMRPSLPFRLEAWMPETIALMKLRGYVQDCSGTVLESVPGKVRMRMGKTHWFGRRSSSPIEVELFLKKPDANRQNYLIIDVIFHPSHVSLLADKTWRDRCEQLYVQLRSYLMGGITI